MVWIGRREGDRNHVNFNVANHVCGMVLRKEMDRALRFGHLTEPSAYPLDPLSVLCWLRVLFGLWIARTALARDRGQ